MSTADKNNPNGKNGATGKVRGLISEMIGRVGVRVQYMYSTFSVDWTKADYRFWSWLRRGKQPRYELGALFARPITETISSYSLGKGFEAITGNQVTDDQLREFVHDHLQNLIATHEDSMGLGDSYVIVNADGTIDRISPEMVEILTDPPGSKNVIGHKVTTKLETRTITDEYYADRRVQTVQKAEGKTVTSYANLTGRLPITHFPNDPEANEVHGHVKYESLLKLFADYDDVMVKSLDGVRAMGHPLPVIEGADDPDREVEVNKTGEETVYDERGEAQVRPIIDLSRLFMLVLGKGASFKFAQPGAFAQEASRMLQYLFLLMLQHSHIPEWVWGGAIASSMASVEAQTPAFHMFIEGERRKLEKPLAELLTTWLAMIGLFTVGVQSGLALAIIWPALAKENDDLKVKKVELADRSGYITKETGLKALGLVEDPAAEVKAAEAEAQARADTFDQRVNDALANADGAAA